MKKEQFDELCDSIKEAGIYHKLKIECEALEALREFCWCEGSIRSEGLHKNTCIFSGYAPDSSLNKRQKKARQAVRRYQEESQ